MTRPSRVQMFMEIAQVVAKRSTCMRLNVGAVIVHQRRIVSIGYNGVPAGEEHCRGNNCPGKLYCELTTHAEVNALKHLPPMMDGPLDLYVTDSPCLHCFNRLLDDGRVNRIFFQTPYRVSDHLTGQDMGIYRVLPAGYVMDWTTKELVDVET